jgi:hypothetical protein
MEMTDTELNLTHGGIGIMQDVYDNNNFIAKKEPIDLIKLTPIIPAIVTITLIGR